MCKLSNDAVKEHDFQIWPYSVCRSEAAASQALCADLVRGDNYTSWCLKYNT